MTCPICGHPGPALLDLFCGAGGCTKGYQRTGFHVTGVDNRPQPRYVGEHFIQADALDVLTDRGFLAGFDVVHASPPCQRFSQGAKGNGTALDHPDLLTPTIKALCRWGGPWVVENVEGAPLPGALVLCGSEFGLAATDDDGRDVRLRRHRLFDSNIHLMGAGGCHCAEDRYRQRIAGSYGGGRRDPVEARLVRHGGYAPSYRVRGLLLGIDWMTGAELTQAIPPAYTEFIGEQLRLHLAYAEGTPDNTVQGERL